MTPVAYAYNPATTGIITLSSVAVAAGTYHSLALLRNGTVVAWGDNNEGESNVPTGLTNVVAIAASGDPSLDTAYSMALKSDGTVVTWGYDEAVDPVDGLTNVIAISAGADHALAVRTGPPTPVITLEPTDEYQVAGASVTFATRGLGLAGVQYQWQFYGTNLNNAFLASADMRNVNLTNTTMTLAVMEFANLGGANLTSANLSSGDCIGTIFTNATLNSVNFTSANLSQANFLGATTNGAIFTGATFSQTIMPDGSIRNF